MKSSWREERAELAIWLRSYTETIARWIKKFLEDPEHPVSKTKMLEQIDQWIQTLQEYQTQIMMLKSDSQTDQTDSKSEQTESDETD